MDSINKTTRDVDLNALQKDYYTPRKKYIHAKNVKSEGDSKTETEKQPKVETKTTKIVSTTMNIPKDIDVANSIHQLKDIPQVVLDPPKSGQDIIDQNNRDYRSSALKISVNKQKIKLQDNQQKGNADLLRNLLENNLDTSSVFSKYKEQLSQDQWTFFKELMIEEILYAGTQSPANEMSLKSQNHGIKFKSTNLKFTTDPNLQLRQHNTASFIPYSDMRKDAKGKNFKFDIVVNLNNIAEHYFNKIFNNQNTTFIPDSSLE